MTEWDIRNVCQDLIDRKQYRSVANFILTNKRIHDLCQPLLTASKPTPCVRPTTGNERLAGTVIKRINPQITTVQKFEQLFPV